jgi:hypothetical protein
VAVTLPMPAYLRTNARSSFSLFMGSIAAC